MEEKKLPAGLESPALHTHLNLLQGVINRMAGNSALCKTLCITLVAAIAAIAASGSKPGAVWVALLPLLIFAVLDMMYLSLEKGFRDKYDDDVKRLYEGTLHTDDLFRIAPPVDYKALSALREAAKSWSVWLVYLPVLVLLILVRWILG